MRITGKMLEAVVDRINTVTGSPPKPWVKNKAGRLRAQVGNYHLDGAYGGWTLHRMVNKSGGVTVPLSHGYFPKRELYGQMQAFLRGLEMGK